MVSFKKWNILKGLLRSWKFGIFNACNFNIMEIDNIWTLGVKNCIELKSYFIEPHKIFSSGHVACSHAATLLVTKRWWCNCHVVTL